MSRITFHSNFIVYDATLMILALISYRPPGQHVVQLFVQYVPYHLAEDAWSTISAPLHPTMHLQPRKSAAADKLAQITKNLPKTAASWSDPAFTEAYVTRILAILDLYLDDFSSTVLHIDALSPLELEKVFALQEGCIFHQVRYFLDQMHTHER